jgi:hypothetical protein
LLVSEDPDEAAAALVRLSRDQELWRRCSLQTRGLVVERFSAERSYARWKALIQSLPKPSASPHPLRPALFSTLPRPEPLLMETYRRGAPFGQRLGQRAATAIARLKQRIKQKGL